MTRINCQPLLRLVAAIPLASSWATAFAGRVGPDFTHQPTLYVVSYSHLDTQWCWTYRQSILDYIPTTLRESFDLFERFPDYKFNWTGALRYKLAKEYYPDEYKRLKGYVAAGRWIPTGSSWDECDVIVPGPESIIRQILYSNQFFKREFGKTSNQFMLPDAFGFPASLPTILAHCGLKGFSTKKLDYGAGCAVGIPFNLGRWVGVDGQSVIAALNPGDYRTRVTEDLSYSSRWLDRLQADGKASGVFWDYMYHGNGDEGGTPGAASVAWLEKSQKGSGPVQVRAGGADDLFHDITPELAKGLPSYKGDLLLIQHSAGSINSGATIKKWNRECEALAASAESASVGADWLGALAYPGDQIADSWQRFLGAQMHDILPGTSIPQAYEYGWNDQAIAKNRFSDVTVRAVEAIASRLDTRGAGVPLVVFNPVSADRDDVVETEVADAWGPNATVAVFDPSGKAVPTQVVARSAGRVHFLFAARVPSMGCSVFHLKRTTSIPVSALRATKNSVENSRYRVTLNEAGDVSGIFDKRSKREVLSSPIRLAFLYEKPQHHPAWNMEWSDRQKPPVGYVDGLAKIEIVERGPVRVALRVTRNARGSAFAQTVRLSVGGAGNRVEFSDAIDWRSQECSLKAVFPLTVSNPMATYSWGVGTIQRGNNEPKKYEVPTHDWLDQSAGDYGLALLNHARYGSDKPDDHAQRLTLLYTPGVRDGYQHQGWQDWGKHEIRYALEGHTGDWRDAGVQASAAFFNEPCTVAAVPAHSGRGRSVSLVRTSSQQLAVMALKKAEDSDRTIVRVNELTGRPVHGGSITFPLPIAEVEEVDGQENAIQSGLPEAARGRSLTFDMAPYRPRAFSIRFRRPAVKARPMEFVALGARRDGNGARFASDGRSMPANMMPSRLTSGGIDFRLEGSLACVGQKIQLPEAREPSTLGLLMASTKDVPAAPFFVGGRIARLNVQDWSGTIGQGDTRLWSGPMPDKAFAWPLTCIGVKPGFTKPAPIAWYSDHVRLSDGTNDPYRFCYLFRYEIGLLPGDRTLRLPNDPRIHVFAATVAGRG